MSSTLSLSKRYSPVPGQLGTLGPIASYSKSQPAGTLSLGPSAASFGGLTSWPAQVKGEDPNTGAMPSLAPVATFGTPKPSAAQLAQGAYSPYAPTTPGVAGGMTDQQAQQYDPAASPSQMARLDPTTAAWLGVKSEEAAQGKNEALATNVNTILGIGANGQQTAPIYSDAYWASRKSQAKGTVDAQVRQKLATIQDQVRRGGNPLAAQRAAREAQTDAQDRVAQMNDQIEQEREQVVEQGSMNRAKVEAQLAGMQPYAGQDWPAVEQYMRQQGYADDLIAMAKQQWEQAQATRNAPAVIPGGGGSPNVANQPFGGIGIAPGNANAGGGQVLGNQIHGGGGAAAAAPAVAADPYAQFGPEISDLLHAMGPAAAANGHYDAYGNWIPGYAGQLSPEETAPMGSVSTGSDF
jgi:hypothetical protein